MQLQAVAPAPAPANASVANDVQDVRTALQALPADKVADTLIVRSFHPLTMLFILHTLCRTSFVTSRSSGSRANHILSWAPEFKGENRAGRE
jgi:hypothetical protein